MKPDPSSDTDLKSRFARLRRADAVAAPSFAGTLAAARVHKASSVESPPSGWVLVPLAAAAAIMALFVPLLRKDTTVSPLAEVIPVLLPTSPESKTLFPSLLFADGRVPSDSVLPLHLDFPL